MAGPGGQLRRRPLYEQAADHLRDAIHSGQFPSNRLPTESALCKQFGVSLITIKRALKELAEQGLIVRRRGSGTFVKQASSLPGAGARRKTYLFCYVSGSGVESFPGNFANRLMVACQKRGEGVGYDPVLVRAREGETPAPLARNKVDGVILAGTCQPEGAIGESSRALAENNERYVRGVAEKGYPVVAVSNYAACPSVHRVLPDYEQGLRDALIDLKERGHRRIGICGGPFDRPPFKDRLDSLLKLAGKLGLEAGEPWFAAYKVAGWKEPQAARDTVIDLLRLEPRVTALLSLSGPPMLPLDAIRSAGLRSPEDVSYIAFSDNPRPLPGDPPHIDPDARTTHEMALVVSTVEPLAEAAVTRLLKLIEGHSFTPRESVIRTPVEYVTGATVGPPRT